MDREREKKGDGTPMYARARTDISKRESANVLFYYYVPHTLADLNVCARWPVTHLDIKPEFIVN